MKWKDIQGAEVMSFRVSPQEWHLNMAADLILTEIPVPTPAAQTQLSTKTLQIDFWNNQQINSLNSRSSSTQSKMKIQMTQSGINNLKSQQIGKSSNILSRNIFEQIIENI